MKIKFGIIFSEFWQIDDCEDLGPHFVTMTNQNQERM